MPMKWQRKEELITRNASEKRKWVEQAQVWPLHKRAFDSEMKILVKSAEEEPDTMRVYAPEPFHGFVFEIVVLSRGETMLSKWQKQHFLSFQDP